LIGLIHDPERLVEVDVARIVLELPIQRQLRISPSDSGGRGEAHCEAAGAGGVVDDDRLALKGSIEGLRRRQRQQDTGCGDAEGKRVVKGRSQRLKAAVKKLHGVCSEIRTTTSVAMGRVKFCFQNKWRPSKT